MIRKGAGASGRAWSVIEIPLQARPGSISLLGTGRSLTLSKELVSDVTAGDTAPPLPSREPPERRAHCLARYEEVVALRARGASVRTIAARVGIGQRTVQRWLRAGRFPERRQRSQRPGQVAPFAA